MMSSYTRSLFIFRRDLRLHDNRGLLAALQQSQQVLVCFIFDPRQIAAHPYQSQPGLQFMLESIQDLQQQCRQHGCELGLFADAPEAVVTQVKQQYGIQAVFVNRDYTPFSRQRDLALQTHCSELQLDFHYCADALLNEPEQVLKSDATAYQVFTAFYQRASRIPVALPADGLPQGLISFQTTDSQDILASLQKPHHHLLAGGRCQALLGG